MEISSSRASPVFSAELKRRREDFNRRVSTMHRAGRAVDSQEFSAILRELVGPVVEAVAAVDGEAARKASWELFGVALELCAAGLLGGTREDQELRRLWQGFVALPRLFAEAPQELAVALSNGVYFQQMDPQGDAPAWGARILQVAESCGSSQELLEAGKVLAWTVGMAHFREPALLSWQRLSDEAKYSVLGVDPNRVSMAQLVRRLRDPWWEPKATEPTRGVVERVGGFVGDGGPFRAPPVLASDEEEVIASDGEEVFRLYADIFGACFRRAPGATFLQQPGVDKAVAARFGEIFEARDIASAVTMGKVTVVSLVHSHFVYLFVEEP